MGKFGIIMSEVAEAVELSRGGTKSEVKENCGIVPGKDQMSGKGNCDGVRGRDRVSEGQCHKSVDQV